MGHSMAGWKPPEGQLGKLGPPLQKLIAREPCDGTMPLYMYAHCTLELRCSQGRWNDQQKCWGWRQSLKNATLHGAERGSMEMGAA